ncbi:hypothetical protein TNCV_2655291 [Trichonephila clavipes]|nr:hypothetical protein TNCV_2655291 [Trichonephila clavipes]
MTQTRGDVAAHDPHHARFKIRRMILNASGSRAFFQMPADSVASITMLKKRHGCIAVLNVVIGTVAAPLCAREASITVAKQTARAAPHVVDLPVGLCMAVDELRPMRVAKLRNNNPHS